MNKLQFTQALLLVAMAAALFGTTHQRNQWREVAKKRADDSKEWQRAANSFEESFNTSIVETKKAQELTGRAVKMLQECRNEQALVNSRHSDAVYYQATSSNLTNVITNTFGFGEIYDEDKRLRDARAIYHEAKEYGALTNLVSLLTLSGEFCRIQGHAWCADLKGYPREQAEKPEWRECLVCGREEERARQDKPWHHSNP